MITDNVTIAAEIAWSRRSLMPRSFSPWGREGSDRVGRTHCHVRWNVRYP